MPDVHIHKTWTEKDGSSLFVSGTVFMGEDHFRDLCGVSPEPTPEPSPIYTAAMTLIEAARQVDKAYCSAVGTPLIIGDVVREPLFALSVALKQYDAAKNGGAA